MNNYFDAFLDLIFPPKCEVCKSSSKAALCQDCFQSVKFMKPHLGIHSVTAYNDVVKHALHQLKFQNKKRLAQPMGVLMVQYLSQSMHLDLKQIDVLVPVPLHPNRLKQRGFNQAHLIALSIHQYYGIKIENALLRVVDTKPQFDLDRKERFNNVKGAFAINKTNTIFNKKVLLIDDIYTTGATIAECANTLKVAGAKRTDILTLARAVE